MTILKTIWDNISTIKGQRNILALALIAVIFFLRGCDGSSDIDVFKYEQNIAALQDSVRTYENKYGDAISEKLALVTEKADLKKYNKELNDEVKKLKDNPIVVTKYITKIVHDTVYITPQIDTAGITFNSDSTAKIIPFTWSDSTNHNAENYRYLAGTYIIEVDTGMNVASKEFAITVDEIGLSFTTGITENDNDQVEIFITSDYPGFKPTAINGALFDPRESDVIKKFFPAKKWGVGVYAGYGFYFDPQRITLGSGIQVGIGVSYNLFQWVGKK
jgi:hypothetical protein